MTYYEAYSACQNETQIKEMALYDTKVAVFLGNPDRIKEIEEAMNRAIADKGESEEQNDTDTDYM